MGVFPSFMYGECFSLFRSSVTSKKFTLVRLASTVILRSLSRKIWQISFLTLSISRGVFLNADSPSSRYRPMFLPNFSVRRDRM